MGVSAKRPPKWFWLPTKESSGTKYHAKVCGAHSLEPYEREEAELRISAYNLEPCGNCMAHHGLKPIEQYE